MGRQSAWTSEQMMALEVEYETYLRELPHLLAEEGKYVLIRGNELFGTFDTFEQGLHAGYERFGLDGFMLQEIRPAEYAVDIVTPFFDDDDEDESRPCRG